MNGWDEVRSWLTSREGDYLMDGAVIGDVAEYEYEELLADFDVEPTRANLRQLGRLINELLCSGH